jgi:hypothetical protein
MNILMRGFSTDEHYNADIEFVFVQVTKELAELILKRRKSFLAMEAEDKKLCEIYFFDHHATYLSYGAVPDEFQDETLKPLSWSPEEDSSENVEVAQMVLDCDGVRWTAVPKHSDIYITSETIPFTDIAKALTP